METSFLENESCFDLFGGQNQTAGPTAFKRRKLDNPAKGSSTIPTGQPNGAQSQAENPFVPLLNGLESPECVALRYTTYETLSSRLQDRINSSLSQSNEKTLEDVIHFISKVSPSSNLEKLHTGLISIGPSIASHGLLFKQLRDQISSTPGTAITLLTSSDVPNLKGALKHINRGFTRSAQFADGTNSDSKTKTRRLLDFDLNILQKFAQRNNVDKFVICFQDSEAVNGEVLVNLLEHLHSWLDRIPFVLIFGVATSVDLFYERLPKASAQIIQGTKFTTQRHDELLEQFFTQVIRGELGAFRPGGSLSTFLLSRQRDHVQSVQAFFNGLKYACMSHFFANPLSIFLETEKFPKCVQKEHLQAIRNLPSFQKHAESLILESRPQTLETASKLLDDTDESYFIDYLKKHLGLFEKHMNEYFEAIKVLITTRSFVPNLHSTSVTAVYIETMSNTTNKSAKTVDETLLEVKKLGSDVIGPILSNLIALKLSDDSLSKSFEPLEIELKELIEEQKTQTRPLRSAHDSHQSSVRTTIVDQKVSLLSKRPITSTRDESYTLILQRLHKLLKEYFDRTLQSPANIFLSEIFFYDRKVPHRAVFTPRPGFALERALFSPHDYLGCECCFKESELKAQPPTAILYQLFSEGGILINVNDLWEQFRGIIRGDQGEDNDEGDRETLFLFYKALADLKFLGMIKHNRKKPDHVAKLAWRGL